MIFLGVNFYLVDAHTNRRIGHTKINAYTMIQISNDAHFAKETRATSRLNERIFNENKTESIIDGRGSVMCLTAAEVGEITTEKIYEDSETKRWNEKVKFKFDMTDLRKENTLLGTLKLTAEFVEDIDGLFLSSQPHLCPTYSEEEMSLV